MEQFKTQAQKLPEKSGVYRFYSGGTLQYVGKANNLRHRVMSYLLKAHNDRLAMTLSAIDRIDYTVTNSAIEALLLEASEIQSKQPPLNIKLKDDKSFLGIYITKEEFPRIFPARLSNSKLPKGTFYGPYTSAKTLRNALKVLRKLFPYCEDPELRFSKRACFYYHLGQCPGVCVGAITKEEYRRNINRLILFIKGSKSRVVTELKKEMANAAKQEKYELAALYKKQLDALQNIQDATFELPETTMTGEARTVRIEGYDISNVSGKHASGSMVVMDCIGLACQINKSEYRRFSIRSKDTADDYKMLEEVLVRRFKHDEWPNPQIVLIDGGLGQLQVGRKIAKIFDPSILVVSIAKGKERKRNDLHGEAKRVLQLVNLEDLVRLRDEAHRFAISGYRKRHSKAFFN